MKSWFPANPSRPKNSIGWWQNPVKEEGAEEGFRHPPPPGEHTEEILRNLLGFNSQRIHQLPKEEAITTATGEPKSPGK